jgi:hypothetical protein
MRDRDCTVRVVAEVSRQSVVIESYSLSPPTGPMLRAGHAGPPDRAAAFEHPDGERFREAKGFCRGKERRKSATAMKSTTYDARS